MSSEFRVVYHLWIREPEVRAQEGNIRSHWMSGCLVEQETEVNVCICMIDPHEAKNGDCSCSAGS
jgi:hypothetical protein